MSRSLSTELLQENAVSAVSAHCGSSELYHVIRAAKQRSGSKEASQVLVHHSDLKHEASFFSENHHCWRAGLRLIQHASSLILGSIFQECACPKG